MNKRHFSCLMLLSFSTCLAAQTSTPIRTPIGDTLTKALATSSLTAPGSRPFHVKLQIHDVINAAPDYNAEIEEYWSSPTLWRRIITAPNLRHVTTVNESGTHVEWSGDYFPLWLRAFVNAIVDPVPMEIWNKPDLMLQQTLLRSGSKSVPCANVEMRFDSGQPTPASLCFFLNGLLSSVDTPGYVMEFNEFSDFHGKQIARLYRSWVQPETLLVGRIAVLEQSNKKADFFATAQSQSNPDPLAAYRIRASQIERISENSTGINWPTVSAGKTEGSISLFVSVDNHGRVREASVLSSDNPEINQPAVEQVLRMQWKAATSKGLPIQIEGPLFLSFATKTDPASKTPAAVVDIPAAVVGGKAISQPRPEYPLAALREHISGAVYLHAVIAADGRVDKLGVIDSSSPILSEAALKAVRQWKYEPYLLDGIPTRVSTTITVNFNFGPSSITRLGR